MLWLRGRKIWIRGLKEWKNVTFAISYSMDQLINCQKYLVRLAKRNFIPIACTNGFLPVRIPVVLFVEHYFEMLNFEKNLPINNYFFYRSLHSYFFFNSSFISYDYFLIRSQLKVNIYNTFVWGHNAIVLNSIRDISTHFSYTTTLIWKVPIHCIWIEDDEWFFSKFLFDVITHQTSKVLISIHFISLLWRYNEKIGVWLKSETNNFSTLWLHI